MIYTANPTQFNYTFTSIVECDEDEIAPYDYRLEKNFSIET